VNRIALVEDHERMAALICKAFAGTGIEVEVFDRISRARAAIGQLSYSVLVVDRGLPDGDGLEMLRKLRAQGCLTPCLMLTARDALHDRVEGLEVGADDYLVKPFSMKELVARVGAASRRSIRREETPRGEPIEIEELRIDPLEVQAFVDGVSAELTPTEFRLLYQLALDRGRVVTRDELLQKLWGRRESHRDRTVDVFIRRLRDKVDRRAPRHTFIQTRYGVGYKLEPEPKS
jgi:DNA-binding response OmpR family regulator